MAQVEFKSQVQKDEERVFPAGKMDGSAVEIASRKDKMGKLLYESISI